MDFVVPGRGRALTLIECKAGRTVTPAMAAPLQRLAEAIRKTHPRHARPESYLVHEAPRTPARTTAVAPGVQALPWEAFGKRHE